MKTAQQLAKENNELLDLNMELFKALEAVVGALDGLKKELDYRTKRIHKLIGEAA